jgi:hypothetical protein
MNRTARTLLATGLIGISMALGGMSAGQTAIPSAHAGYSGNHAQQLIILDTRGYVEAYLQGGNQNANYATDWVRLAPHSAT